MILLLLACSSDPPVVELPAVVLQPGVPWTVPSRERFEGELASIAPEAAGMDAEALSAFSELAFEAPESDPERRGQRTDALVVLRHGKVVLERYGRGTTPDTPLLTWSVTKSFGATVVGAAVHEGLLDVQQPLCATYAPMCEGARARVRVTDALQMSSGLDWQETYETSPVFSSVMAMLYSAGHADMAAFTASQELTSAPGTRWVYSSGDSNLVSAALKQPLGDRYPTFWKTAVADRIGMTTAVYEADAAGTHVASSYLYASARDLARWGQLVLDDGMWNGERLLAPGWVRYTTTLAPAFHTTEVGLEHRTSNPGAQWYVNVGDPDRGLERPWPSLPADAFGASGHWGKVIWVIPSWDMVVVRMGDDRKYGCGAHSVPGCLDPDGPIFTKDRFLAALAKATRPHAPEGL